MTLIEKDARQPAITLAANNNNPANAERARHRAILLAARNGSQAEWIDRIGARSLTLRSPCPLRIALTGRFRLRAIPKIPSQHMRRYKLWAAIVPFLFALASGGAQAGQTPTGQGHIFIIAAADGYGVEDCLAEGGECGRIVADAWCEAHGHGAAIAFGPAEDVTDAIPAGVAAKKSQRPYMVRCGD
jgi:hypothetical protein